MNEKVQPLHCQRVAYVYVRQSTMHQVRNNLESQRRQYALSKRAEELGFHEVRVIDDDLGRSGSGTVERPGFGRLLGAVCSGQVGAVLALEASRLARNNRDWYHLLDLCAMTDTLVIDYDGVYDPGRLNDRLLLGLKGTMSEFELGLLNQRAQEALRQKIGRGEVLTEVPIGYLRTEDNRIEMTPDLQVQTAIRGIFSKFREMGSVRQVLLWYHAEKIPLPGWFPGSGRPPIHWRLPIYNRILAVLKNPTYAGAFVYGRRCTQTVVVEGRARKTDGHWVPMEKWPVLIKDHHPGYISWETFVNNQQLIEANAGMRGTMATGKTGAAKSGSALLAGLLRCGRCGRKLHVGYGGKLGRVVSYFCRGAMLNHGRDKCLRFGALRVDQAVASQVLEALQPQGTQAALDAWDRLRHDKDQQYQSWSMALEKARYESNRIKRQYDAVEPENRLVAGELEKRWNDSLSQVAELEGRLKALEAARTEVTETARRKLLELGEQVEYVWNHPSASMILKKRIVRAVLKEIIINEMEDPPRVSMTLHWMGGVHTELIIPRNRPGHHGRMTDRNVVELVRDLAKVCHDHEIVAILNKLGYRTGTGSSWTESRVLGLRVHNQIPGCGSKKDRPWVTLEQAARELAVYPNVLRRLLTRGILPGKQTVKFAPWIIERKDLQLPAVQNVVKAVREGRGLPIPQKQANQPLLFEKMSEV